MYVAKRTGCRVTGITVAEEQLKYCRELLAKEDRERESASSCSFLVTRGWHADKGLAERVSFEFADYRVFAERNKGRFNRIISCEMLEAVCSMQPCAALL